MKNLLLVFLIIVNFAWADEKKIDNEQVRVLTGFQKFKVVTLLPFFERVDRKVIFDTMAESFKKYGQVVVSEKKSMFQSLIQLDAQDPICFFVIDKDEEQINGTLEIITEVEVVGNRQKTTCSIWKKSLSASIPPEMKNQPELVIANLINEMMDDVSNDWVKANKDSKKPVFQINKFQEL